VENLRPFLRAFQGRLVGIDSFLVAAAGGWRDGNGAPLPGELALRSATAIVELRRLSDWAEATAPAEVRALMDRQRTAGP